MEFKAVQQSLMIQGNLMTTHNIEKQNLEAHVGLCAERYSGLIEKIGHLESRLASIDIILTEIHTRLHADMDKQQNKWFSLGISIITIQLAIIGYLLANYITL